MVSDAPAIHSAMRPNLSKARTWEYHLKDGTWRVDELGFSQLPKWLRVQVWTEAMLAGPRCHTPTQKTLDLISGILTPKHERLS